MFAICWRFYVNAAPAVLSCRFEVEDLARYELDGFLKKRGVWLEYSLDDFRREGQTTASLLPQQGKETEQDRGEARDGSR